MYAKLAGDVVAQAKALVEAMGRAGVKRLVWISSQGIYGEIPGAFGEGSGRRPRFRSSSSSEAEVLLGSSIWSERELVLMPVAQ